jgi:hypothetical protein
VRRDDAMCFCGSRTHTPTEHIDLIRKGVKKQRSEAYEEARRTRIRRTKLEVKRGAR